MKGEVGKETHKKKEMDEPSLLDTWHFPALLFSAYTAIRTNLANIEHELCTT